MSAAAMQTLSSLVRFSARMNFSHAGVRYQTNWSLSVSRMSSLREPVCQGRTVSAWIEELGDNSSAAARALREIGPGAVAPLIQALERKPAGWLNAYAIVVVHSPRFLKPSLANCYSDIARRESRLPRVRAAAAQVLGDFGPDAGRAPPSRHSRRRRNPPASRCKTRVTIRTPRSGTARGWR